jgi:hypothetical protein
MWINLLTATTGQSNLTTYQVCVGIGAIPVADGSRAQIGIGARNKAIRQAQAASSTLRIGALLALARVARLFLGPDA